MYVVTGWVRRIKRHESDSDWHIEITEEEETPVAQCIVVEIPNPEFGAIYRQARDELDALVASIPMNSRGDLDVPILLRFTGAAFFDGYHQTHPKHGGPARAPTARPLQQQRARALGAAPGLQGGGGEPVAPEAAVTQPSTATAPDAAARAYVRSRYTAGDAAARAGIALCLSGGGYRAALFHLGGIRRLHELGVLPRLAYVSSVSGGSIAAGFLARAIARAPAGVITDFDAEFARPLREFTRRNIRTPAILRRLLPWNWFRSDTGVRAIAGAVRAPCPISTWSDLPATAALQLLRRRHGLRRRLDLRARLAWATIGPATRRRGRKTMSRAPSPRPPASRRSSIPSG